MKRILMLSFSILFFSCATGEQPPAGDRAAEPIVGGHPTAGDPAVGPLIRHGVAFCSGTLIAPRVVLTAAHCVWGIDLARVHVYFGDEVGSSGVWLSVTRGLVHPLYLHWSPANYDIALLALESDGPTPPAPIRRASLMPQEVGSEVHLVGFGVADPQVGDAGIKRRAVALMTGYSAYEFAYGGVGQTCSGDSGGPAFTLWDGVATVAGVTSRGDPDCTAYGVDIRVDAHLEFVQPFIDAHGGGAPDASTGGGAPPGAACGGVDYDGVCAADELRYCEAGTLIVADCSSNGDVCACDDGFCECVRPPCGGLDFHGECVEDLLRWCDDGVVREIDCTDQGGVCAWQSSSIGYDCEY